MYSVRKGYLQPFFKKNFPEGADNPQQQSITPYENNVPPGLVVSCPLLLGNGESTELKFPSGLYFMTKPTQCLPGAFADETGIDPILSMLG